MRQTLLHSDQKHDEFSLPATTKRGTVHHVKSQDQCCVPKSTPCHDGKEEPTWKQ